MKSWVVLRAPLSGQAARGTGGDSELYESCRIWWGDLWDLLRSHHAPTFHRRAVSPPLLFGTAP